MLIGALAIALLQIAPTSGPSAESSAGVNYLVGPQDVLIVTVFNEPQLSGHFRVENEGQFDYPFLGPIKAAGTTVTAIAAQVRGRLADGYVRNPQVTVEIEQFRSQSVFVMGEVRLPGKYTLTKSVTLVEALTQAGSTAPSAGNEVLILHAKPFEGETDRVDLSELQAGKLSTNVAIHDGDTIFVPKAQRFYVLGQVRNPGTYALEPNLTVLQAISIAGGLTDRGSNRGMRIVRNKKELKVKLSDLVQPGDTIIVRQRLM